MALPTSSCSSTVYPPGFVLPAAPPLIQYWRTPSPTPPSDADIPRKVEKPCPVNRVQTVREPHQCGLGYRCTLEVESLNYHRIKAILLVARARPLRLAREIDSNDYHDGERLRIIWKSAAKALSRMKRIDPNEILKEIQNPEYWDAERRYLESPGCLEQRERASVSTPSTGIYFSPPSMLATRHGTSPEKAFEYSTTGLTHRDEGEIPVPAAGDLTVGRSAIYGMAFELQVHKSTPLPSLTKPVTYSNSNNDSHLRKLSRRYLSPTSTKKKEAVPAAVSHGPNPEHKYNIHGKRELTAQHSQQLVSHGKRMLVEEEEEVDNTIGSKKRRLGYIQPVAENKKASMASRPNRRRTREAASNRIALRFNWPSREYTLQPPRQKLVMPPRVSSTSTSASVSSPPATNSYPSAGHYTRNIRYTKYRTLQRVPVKINHQHGSRTEKPSQNVVASRTRSKHDLKELDITQMVRMT